MAVARRIAVVAGLLAGVFGSAGLLVYLFAPFFARGPINVPHPALYPPTSLPEHYSIFDTLTHNSGQYQRDVIFQVASMFAGYLLLALLVALAAARLARQVSLRWTVLLWLATATLAVEVVSVSVNARDLLPPFMISPMAFPDYFVLCMLPSVAFAAISALAAAVVLATAGWARLRPWRAAGSTLYAARSTLYAAI